MSLNILHYKHQGLAQWGVVSKGAIRPIPGYFKTTTDFIEANPLERLNVLTGPTIPESDVEWLSPVTANQQIICQGANYRQHMIESGTGTPASSSWSTSRSGWRARLSSRITVSDSFGDFRFGGLTKGSGVYRVEIRHALGNARRQCELGESVYLGEVSLARSTNGMEVA